jgi:pyruvate/2-oxoglutarate dehydrogenase complex dihydrolipoamide acyltransferase (E2) component
MRPLVETDERIPVRGLRRRIWENMQQSAFTAAHFTFVEECDATEIVALRKRFNDKLQKDEAKFTFLPFIVKAVVAALKQFPLMNGHVDDDAMEFIKRADYHIGIAVASERGLIVPVVRHADRRSLVDLQREIVRLADAVRDNKLTQDDLGGSTFTITSLGKDGGIFATPIINYPEVAIMGVHKISRRPMVKDDDDRVVIRDMMNLSLSFDHRLVDGHVGAAFTYTVIRLLENPDRLMMEMS